MTSIRAPWRARPPRDGRDGFDALPALPGEPGPKGKDGEAGKRGFPGPVQRIAALEPVQVLPQLVPWRAPYERDEETRLTLRVTAGPRDEPPVIELLPVRDDRDDILYVDILPLANA